jgi:hypothetical protein
MEQIQVQKEEDLLTMCGGDLTSIVMNEVKFTADADSLDNTTAHLPYSVGGLKYIERADGG